jgi:hypothetical protein
MPALWSVIDIDILSGSVIPALEERTSAFLLRSSELPLKIRLSTVSYDKLNSVPTSHLAGALIDRIVGALLAHCHRCEELQVDSGGGWIEKGAPFHFFSTLKPDLVPKLEKIVLNFSAGLTDNDGCPTPTIFLGPGLRNLTLRKFWAQFPVDTVNWRSLTELSIGEEDADGPGNIWFNGLAFINIPFVVKALGQCSNLVHCSIGLTFMMRRGVPQLTSMSPKDHIFLPRLQSLALYGHWIPPAVSSSFDLPRMTCLSMLPQRSTFNDENAIVEWGTRFGGQLTEFTFCFAALSRAHLLDLLPHLLSISCLRVIRRKPHPHLNDLGTHAPMALFDQVVLDKLTPNLNPENPIEASGECWCPRLQTLHCVIPAAFRHREVKKSREGLISFIAARRIGHHGLALLKELKLELDRDFFSEQSLKSTLRRRGVNCEHFFVEAYASDLGDVNGS